MIGSADSGHCTVPSPAGCRRRSPLLSHPPRHGTGPFPSTEDSTGYSIQQEVSTGGTGWVVDQEELLPGTCSHHPQVLPQDTLAAGTMT